VASLVAVFEAARGLQVKSMYNKFMIGNQKKRENVEIKQIFA